MDFLSELSDICQTCLHPDPVSARETHEGNNLSAQSRALELSADDDRRHVNERAQSSSDHDVHQAGDYWLSPAQSTVDLGLRSPCRTAVESARTIYLTANGCATCHTSWLLV